MKAIAAENNLPMEGYSKKKLVTALGQLLDTRHRTRFKLPETGHKAAPNEDDVSKGEA